MREMLSLYELQEKVRMAVAPLSQGFIWITAEISEIKRNASGHWYLELADYDKENRTLNAKARAMIWSRNAAMLVPFFENATGAPLAAGMQVLLKVQVQYSVLYGLSLNITDIDPSFTVGEIEMRRQQIIRRLKQEEMFGVNSSLEIPLIPKRIAVVSSATAAGYRDFMKHLEENNYGFVFGTKLFEAPMQGGEAPLGIVKALDAIAEEVSAGERYDAVVLVRGGGGVLELACFDDYELALNIAQFPLPVITGIGHDHDFHVADMVAHTYLKTPTAVADFMIEMRLLQLDLLMSLYRRARTALSGRIEENLSLLSKYPDRMAAAVKKRISDEYNRLQLIEYKVKVHDPQRLLDKGFAVVMDDDGKQVTSVTGMRPGDKLKLLMKDGVVELSVLDIKNNHDS